jgi:protein-S-isoprenylcysteine O-methyltransferase Ste14
MRASPIPPPLWTLLFAAAMWVLARHYPLVTAIPDPWNRLGWLVMALATVTPIAALVRFRQAHTTVNPHKPQEATALVTTGVYAWTRNPMYLGLTILLLGLAIELKALSAFLGPVLFVPLIQRFQILPEEHALRLRFGETYGEYCRRVNRWLGTQRG